MSDSEAEKVKEGVEKVKKAAMKKPVVPVLPYEKGLSTGSTLLNLALTGKPGVGILPGEYVLFVGASQAGKTWLSLTALAEASVNTCFADYRLIFDNPENGALMDMERFFGKKLVSRLEPPAVEHDGSSRHSSTVDDFYFHLDDAFDAGKPFLYVLDSMDALTARSEDERFLQNKKASRKDKGEEAKGSMGVAKAKLNSQNLPRVVRNLRKTGSILLIIVQSRDSLAASFVKEETRGGGRALKFYAHSEVWYAVSQKLKKKVREKLRPVGTLSKVRVKKNRKSGWEPTLFIPIYNSLGIDDVGSCVSYLLEEGHWTKSGPTVNAPEFDFKGTEEKLISHIESEGKEAELRLLAAALWGEIEVESQVKRKKRYE